MRSGNFIRFSAIVGMASAALWLIALSMEYRYGLQPPGNGTALYLADQIIFFVALAGYLMMLLGLWKSGAAGDGATGRISVGIFHCWAGCPAHCLGLAALPKGTRSLPLPVEDTPATWRPHDGHIGPDREALGRLAKECPAPAGPLLPHRTLPADRDRRSISDAAWRVAVADNLVHHEPGFVYRVGKDTDVASASDVPASLRHQIMAGERRVCHGLQS